MRYLALTIVLSFATPALADAQETHPVKIDYSTHAPSDCAKVRVAGLATALGLSAFAVPTGAAVIIAGIDTSGGQTTVIGPGAIGAGAAIAALGVGGIVASAIFLKREVEKKRTARRACVAQRNAK